VITTVLEHNSISRPLNHLAKDGVITLTRVPAGSDHLVDPEELAAAFTPATRLVAVSHVSNVTGTIQPIGAIGRLVRTRNALLLVDAAQSAGVVRIDMREQNIDLLVFTGHKSLLGPPGTGGLVVGERAQVSPWREGGTGGDSVSPLHPEEFPHRLEGGTPNVFGIAGLRAGVRLVCETGVEKVIERERELIGVFYRALRDPQRFLWYGADGSLEDERWEGRVGILGLNIPGFEPAETAALLDEQFDIAVRPGLHCAPYAHRHLGTFPNGTVRVSVGFSTCRGDMETAAAAFEEIALD
jgi:selenocysteine lyase/cysteine desulfurase